eukprot:gene32025-16549_t
MAMNLILHTMKDLDRNPITAEDTKWANAELPRPMIHNNFEAASEKCFIGQTFTKTVKSKNGFEWINESKTARPKWGFVATVAGSVLELLIDSRTSQGGADENEIAYLASYESMGKATVACVSGCKCPPSIINGHHTARNSQLHLHNIHVSQHPECVVSITVMAETDSGSTKVKIAGVMISEEIGSDGVKNVMAVEYVHDISSRGKDNVTFEVYNHA